MSSNWPTVKTGEIFDLINGFAFKSKEFCEHGAPVLKIKNVKAGYLSLDNLAYVDPIYLSKKSDKVAQKNDLLITMSGNRHDGSMETWVGKVSWFNENKLYLINQRVGILRLKEGLDINPRYMAYQLSSVEFQKHFIAVATSSGGQANLSPDQIKQTELSCPPRNIQDEIVNQIGSLEDKAKINSDTNQTLEQIAQALFKSWFVDFDPVKAKIETLAAGGSADDAELAAMRVISAKTLDELNSLKASNPEAFNKLAQTAALFPAAMQDSELGEIPEGWSVSSLSELIKITGGGTPKRSEETYWNGNIPWFSVKDVPSEGNVFVVDTDEKISELGLNKSSTKLLPKGTTIITARGTVGKLALVGTDMCMNQSCYGIRGKNVGDFYNYFNLKEAVSTLQRNTHGAVFDTITTQTFDTYSMAFSGADLANKFDELSAPLLQNIEANVRQNIELASLRDTLLPKLLSGEIDLTSEVVA